MSSNFNLAVLYTHSILSAVWQKHFTVSAKRLVLQSLAVLISANGGSCVTSSFSQLIWKKMLGASFTGYNSRSGDLLTIKLRNAWAGNDPASAPSQVHTVLHYDAVLSISDVGAQVLG